ncbi:MULTISPECIES: hypothetical protein [Nocardiaceae]|jgi:hypothetical protein|uniref:hypothetical protein n=1 Tax=Nocardiaceae TaxID=85025 RepID=UPI0005607A7F|nr:MULTISPECIES: hypothetical protein [Rhodococcus]OZE95441.1 hypothetical protein CH301_22720 [Rhodococcus sp. 15-1189-1-1a]OZF10071.1 hypothetical protein CH299_23240 [Rhodococcus sp. 14-2686-1-2]OZF44937.1 hypothetical protein CH293_22700 [Rhodococcus sp. 14-2470-1b]
MRGDRNHLRLVEDAPEVSASVTRSDAANVIAVRADNVRAGQVCEVLHAGVFALSHRVVVPEGHTGVTMSTFALVEGDYEVSLRIDGVLYPSAGPESVRVGERRTEPTTAPSTPKPSYPNIRTAAAGPRSLSRPRSAQVTAHSR